MNEEDGSAPRHWGAVHVRRWSATRRGRRKPVTHVGHALRYGRATRCFSLVPAGMPHGGTPPGDVDWMLGFCAHCIAPGDSPLLSPFERVRLGGSPMVVVAEERAAWIEQLFSELEGECQRSAPEARALRQALLHLLLGEIRRAQTTTPTHAAAGLVSQALEYIWAHALEPLSLLDVAKHVGRSDKHVAAEIKRATGHSVGTWVRFIRVEAAADLLLHTDDSVAQIGERVGWSDVGFFRRQFRATRGQTPAAWRRAARAAQTTPTSEVRRDREK